MNKINEHSLDLNKENLLTNNFFYFWKDFKLNLQETLLSNNVLYHFISSFYENVIFQKDIINYAIIFKVMYTDNTIRSISKVLIINKNTTKGVLIDRLMLFWDLKSDQYRFKEIDNIIISYRILSTKKNYSNLITKKENSHLNKTKEFNYDSMSLPITTDLNNWGVILSQDNPNSLYLQSNIKKGSQIVYYNVFKYTNYNLIQVFINNNLLVIVKDFFLNNNSNPTSFKRIINNNEFIYVNGILTSKKIKRKVQYIKPISKSLYRTDNFITLDIETKNINGVLKPICISIYDGYNVKSFFISDYKSEIELIIDSFNTFKSRKYNYQRVFIHNLSYFDGVFLLKYLSLVGNVKPLLRNGKIYNIRLELLGNKKQKYVLYLRDSLLLLPLSLEKLGRSFNIKNIKTIFPIHSVNELPLDYIGLLPSKIYFKNDTEYENYTLNHKGTWNLKEELIKYCENDVISLHQIINKFSLEIFRLFRVDILKYLTLSSLAFAIYRSNFMSKDNLKISKITGEMFEDIYKSYIGGLVDMYEPEGKNVYLYDVNSEYPEAMCKDMPGGNVTYFEGNLDLNDNLNFGFFKAKIIANPKLNIPILPVKHNNTTLCPLGEWTGWYFSEELKEAKNKYGYKITILKGYIFERINVFEEYVKSLYSQKENTPKNDPKYLIFKLLLNMLYGRFGMKPDISATYIINSSEAENYYSNQNITINEVIDLGNGQELIKVTKNNQQTDKNDIISPNISIAIASAVVAYGRIKINSLKYLDGIKVFYSDTDSVVTDKPLPIELLGSKLGQLKIEQQIKIGYFIAPKVYGFLSKSFDNIVKIKGFKKNLFFQDLYPVLYKDTVLKINHEKWYRNWTDGNIIIKKEIYSLMITGNKRQLIFDSSLKLVGTRPYILKNGYIINKNIDFIYNIKAPNFKDKLITNP